MKRDGGRTVWWLQPGVNEAIASTEFFEESEAKKVAIKAQSPGNVLRVNHGVVQFHFDIIS